MDKAIATVAIWMGPAFACWAIDNPWIACTFLVSFLATVVVWMGDGLTIGKGEAG